MANFHTQHISGLWVETQLGSVWAVSLATSHKALSLQLCNDVRNRRSGKAGAPSDRRLRDIAMFNEF